MSASRIKTFLRCPMQFWYRYSEGLIIAPSSALTVGSSFHSTIGENYKQKIESRKDMKIDDVLDIFSTDFDERAHTTRWLPDEKQGKIKDRAVATLEYYQDVVAPGTQPVAVEKEFLLTMMEDGEQAEWGFHGFIDQVDEKGVIVETKTSSKRPNQPSLEDRLQTAAYAAGMQVEQPGIKPVVCIDYAVKTIKPQIMSFTRKIHQEEIRFLLNVMNRVIAAIRVDIFIPNRHVWTCSDKGCGYWDLCHRKLGGVDYGKVGKIEEGRY